MHARVGTQIFHWTDESRDEWFSDDPIDKRELMVQVWYPSKLTSSQIDPWIDNARDRTSELVEFYKVPKFVAKAVDRVDSHSYYGAKPIDEQIFPIIISLSIMQLKSFLNLIFLLCQGLKYGYQLYLELI